MANLNHLTTVLPYKINFVNLGTHLILVCVRVLHYLTKMARSPLSITIETVLEHGEYVAPHVAVLRSRQTKK